MAEQVVVAAERRGETGKGAARTLRRAGKIPAVIYGHGREPEALVLDATAFGRAIQGHAVSSTILDVSVSGGATVKALVREMQRDPLRADTILHVDLYEVRADEAIVVEVPIHLVGIADGVRNFGGVVDHSLRAVEIRVLPNEIPGFLELDVTSLGIGDHLSVRDLVLPAGEFETDLDTIVCSVQAPRAEEVAPVAAPAAESEASAEPELIRKPKAEDEADEKE
jgi:large subunit ribosomal protein L25